MSQFYFKIWAEYHDFNLIHLFTVVRYTDAGVRLYYEIQVNFPTKEKKIQNLNVSNNVIIVNHLSNTKGTWTTSLT